jgi:hypothetical protein
MTRKIFFEKEKSAVVAIIEGEFNSRIASKIFIEIFEILETEGCRNVLINCENAIENEHMFNVYEFANYLLGEFNTSRKKIAFIKKSDTKLYKFFETVARNRGLNVYVFKNNNKAYEWFDGESK